jgi:hypothetical protein
VGREVGEGVWEGGGEKEIRGRDTHFIRHFKSGAIREVNISLVCHSALFWRKDEKSDDDRMVGRASAGWKDDRRMVGW